MREFKFRAYYLLPDEQKVHEKAYAEWSVDWEGCSLGYVLDNPDYAVVQYTGIKDRNGVEIYEGDVVNVLGSQFNPNTYAREDRIKFTGEVYWREDRWFIKNKTDGDYDNGDFYDGDEINWTNVKIIGNIYEYPELLK